jgi:putative addiction module component (TIGR02574 family)
MARAAKDIEKELLTLPHQERARLAHALLVSLDEDEKGNKNVEAAWLEEVQRREHEIEAGEASWVPYDDAMGKIKKDLK